MARPMTFSASRIGTWMACNSKAGWQYIAGYRDSGNEDTEFGTAVHAVLEACKRDGTTPDMMTEEGAVAAEALPIVDDFRVDAPRDSAQTEGEYFLQGRHRWTMRIDLRRPGHVVDYKTTSDFKWAKTAESLQHDPQAVLYAMHEFSLDPALQTVRLTWLYLKKRAPYACLPVEATMTREHAEKAFAALETFADEMQAAADAAPLDPAGRHRYVLDVLDKNTDHCPAYRGCPHRTRCNLPFFSEPKGPRPVNDLLARLEAMNAATSSPLPPDREAPPMMGVPSPVASADGKTTFSPTFLDQPDAPADAPATEPAMPIAAEVTPNAVNPPSPRRGRPPGSKNKPKADAPAEAPTPVTAIVVAPTPVSDPPLSSATPTPEPHRLQGLFVGCTVRGGHPTAHDFDTLIAKAKIAIGPQDYRLYEYGKGNGMLLQMFQGIVEYEKPSAIVVTDARVPEAILCLSYLRSIADTVVEALR